MSKQIVRNDSQLIDTISYLASLSSNPAEISPMLETMHTITTTRNRGATLSDAKRKMLLEIEKRIRSYLINDDPLRNFTTKDLNDLTENHFYVKNHNNSKTFQTIVTITAGIIIVCALISQLPLSSNQKIQTIPVILSSSMLIYIAWLFLSGIKNFNPRLQQAYQWISSGFIMIGIGAGLSPATMIFPDLSSTVFFRYGLITPIFAIAYILIYHGVRLFAKTLNTKSQAASAQLVASTAAIASALIVLIPHPTTEPSELYFRITLISYAIAITLSSYSAYLAYKISHQIGSKYASSMKWFAIATGCVSLIAAAFATHTFTVGQVHSEPLAVFSVLFATTGILLIVSGNLFKKQQP